MIPDPIHNPTHKLRYHLATHMLLLLCFLLGTGSAQAGADPQLFPRPAGIEAAVKFWEKVFTEVDTKHGYIHDDWNLNIIYEKIYLSPKYSRKKNRKRIKAAKKRYKQILMTLARGKRSGLTAEESRVLNLWPKNVSNSTLKRATRRLRFQLGQSDKFLEGLKRSGRWRSFILDNLKKMGLPREIAALPHVESSFNPDAYSSVGAAGIWQFTRSTGRRFMRVDHVVDERMDPFKASVAAAQLLENNYAVTGTWPLAITAYNHGAAGMRNAARQVGSTDIDKIIKRYKSRSFKFASRNFYTAFLAVNDIQDNYEKYFGKVSLNAPIKDDIINVPAYMSVKTLSKALGISKHELRRKNPALRPAVWNNTKYVPKGYDLRIAPGTVKVNPDKALLQVASNNRFNKQKPDAYHRVRRGQTLSTIAARYGVRVRDIAAINNIRRHNRIRVGQVLRLPQRGKRYARTTQLAKADIPQNKPRTKRVQNKNGYYKVRRGDSINKIARRFGIKQRQLLALNNLSRRKPIYPGQMLLVNARKANKDGYYKVRRGDNITTIAKRFGLKQKQLLALNDINRRKPIYPGQMLLVDVDKKPEPKTQPAKTETVVLASLDTTTDTSTQAVTAPGEDTKQSAKEQTQTATPEEETETDSVAVTDDKQAATDENFLAMISDKIDSSAAKEDAQSESGKASGEEATDSSESDLEAHLPAIVQTESPDNANELGEIEKPVSLENPPAVAVVKQDNIFQLPIENAVNTEDQNEADQEESPEKETTAEKPAASEAEEAEKTASMQEEVAALFADPSDYSVAPNKTIEIQASETLGHYAEWLGIRASRLRRINKMRFRTPVIIGQRLKLDFRKVSMAEFEKQRLAYHQSLQETYFEQYQISGTTKHKVRRGESLWKLAKRKYKIPVWLLRQYNPDLAFNRVKAGMYITFPSVLERRPNSEEEGVTEENGDSKDSRSNNGGSA